MKANSKRKVFGDAVDLLMGDMEEVTMPRGVQMLPVKSIQPFHDHPFHLYEGERLDDMIASVKEHGVLNPVIVQKLDAGYEMLSGHNRWNAAKLAGIKEIPAIVKTDLSEEEAYVYVIETNLMQRSFSDLAISEKAAVLKARYEKEACQGKRNDILEEIARLEGKEISITRGHDDHRLKTRDMIGKEYELSGSSVGRLLKLNDLIKPFKDMVDRGALYTKVAKVVLPKPEIPEQKKIAEILSDADVLITDLQKLIRKKKDIRQGTMQMLVTGKKRLNGYSGEWVKINLAKNSKLKARIGWQGLTTAEYLDEGYSYLITGTDFQDGQIKWNGCHFVNYDRYVQDPNIQVTDW